MNEQISGWAINQDIYHFDHISIADAHMLVDAREGVTIVETINNTFDDSKTMLHHNKYFAMNFPAALGLATQLELSFYGLEIAEQVVAVRAATEDETEEYWTAFGEYKDKIDSLED